MNDTLSSIRRSLTRLLARYVVNVTWEGDTFKHYAIKRNSAFEWANAYPNDAYTIITIVTRY